MKPVKKRVLVISDRPGSRHIRRLLDSIQAKPPTPGRESLAVVRHVPWCSFLADIGPCDCRPDISLSEVKR